MKRKQMEKKKRKDVRTRDWEKDDKHEFAFTHDRVKHRRASVKLPERPEEENPLPRDFTPNGTVIAHSKKWAFVRVDGGERLCLVDERLKERESTLLVPGDRVLVEFEDEEAFVRGVAPRATWLCRPAGRHSRVLQQVIAANIDTLVIVAAVKSPPFRTGFIDRYLIAAEQGGVRPILCVNKMDLCETPPEDIHIYRDLGMPVILTSCETGQGVDELRAALAGTTSVLSGHSGVGKSSLLNALDPALTIHTQEISDQTDRGRHTTTAARLYEMHGGIWIIDTPGLRELGLWRVTAEDVALYFPEIAALTTSCKFRDCTHTHEPACAVRAAAEAGEMSLPRYASYLRIRASLESAVGETPGRFLAGQAPKPLG